MLVGLAILSQGQFNKLRYCIVEKSIINYYFLLTIILLLNIEYWFN
ncbi:hypothetical protein [Candidatus Tisiphia endosymbiont of Empis tessellata]